MPFPANNYVLHHRKTAVEITEPTDKIFSKLYSFGYLHPHKVIETGWEESWPCLIIQADAHIRNFAWQGSMGGVHIGSNLPLDRELRRPHKLIDVILEKAFCEDVGLNALNIFSETQVLIKDCAFRGNWKLSPLIEGGVGQGNLVRINGGSVIFENCLFYNCLNPVLIKANSQVTFNNCHFSVCQTAVTADGRDNPRQNDPFYGGRQGKTLVKMNNCTNFKTKVLTVAGEYANIELSNCFTDGQLYKEDGGKVCLI